MYVYIVCFGYMFQKYIFYLKCYLMLLLIILYYITAKLLLNIMLIVCLMHSLYVNCNLDAQFALYNFMLFAKYTSNIF